MARAPGLRAQPAQTSGPGRVLHPITRVLWPWAFMGPIPPPPQLEPVTLGPKGESLVSCGSAEAVARFREAPAGLEAQPHPPTCPQGVLRSKILEQSDPSPNAPLPAGQCQPIPGHLAPGDVGPAGCRRALELGGLVAALPILGLLCGRCCLRHSPVCTCPHCV